MNIYRITFERRCLNNDEVIIYRLKIESERTIMAEAIEHAIEELPEKVLQEKIADALAEALPGVQTIVARHGQVEVETRRDGNQ